MLSEEDFLRKFRCIACGILADFGEVPEQITTFFATRNRPGPACRKCGNVNYVRCGTMTEFYHWTRRDDVCQVGDHVARRLRSYRLMPRDREVAQPVSGGVALLCFVVKACPEHVAVLREHGLNGFYLSDDN